MRRALALAVLALIWPTAALADPITGAITAIAGFFAEGGTILAAIGRLLLSAALSALSNLLVEKPKEPGLRTTQTLTGGNNPLSFIVGRYATDGVHLAPYMTHGSSGSSRRIALNYVIGISAIPGVTLNRIIIDGEYAPIGTVAHPEFGLPIEGPFLGNAWIKWVDDATAADAFLLDRYASYPPRSWSADMIGRGITYAIFTFRRDEKVFPGYPRVRFECDGIPLYDPRKDSTNGGSGAHRYDNPATWEQTSNPIVIDYNIKRGLTLLDGRRWGGEATAAQLPTAVYAAAANRCDELVPIAGGGTEPRYRAGYEIRVTDEPFDISTEIIKACAGQQLEIGGTFKVQAGGPSLPVFAFTDDDVVITESQTKAPFPGLGEIFNGVEASYPDPRDLWNPRAMDPIYNATYEGEDDNRQLVAQINLPAVSWPSQVRRIAKALIKEERRFARHVVVLPPSAMILEPMDTVSWTSDRFGYVSKRFEVVETTIDPKRLTVLVLLRERDPADYDWVLEDDLATDSPGLGTVRPAALTVPGFTVTATSIPDASGAGRRAAVLAQWTPTDLDGMDGIEWEIRRQGSTNVVNSGSMANVAAGERTISGSILPATSYEMRMRLVTRQRLTSWTDWASFTTPNVRVAPTELPITDLSGNVVLNGDLTDDMQPAWTNIATTFARIARGSIAVSAVTNAPSPFILRMLDDAADQNAWIGDFPARAGQEYALGFQYATSGATAGVSFRLTVVWRDADGVSLTAGSVTVTSSTNITWATAENTIIAPANTAAGSIRIVRLGGGDGVGYVTGLEVTRKRAAVKTLAAASVTKSEIQEGAVSVVDFSVDRVGLTMTTAEQLLGNIRAIVPETYVPNDTSPRNPVIVDFVAEVSVTSASTTFSFLLQRRVYVPDTGGWSTIRQFKFTRSVGANQIISGRDVDGYGATYFPDDPIYQYRFAVSKVAGGGDVDVDSFTATYSQVNK